MNETPGDLQTIEEIVALGELEPGSPLVFTEGPHDASLFQWFINEMNLDGTAVAVSDRVFIPREQTQRYSSDYGERAKALTLSCELEIALKGAEKEFAVIVDADWTDALGPQPILRAYLLVTDFPSIEHYALQDPPLRRFFSLALAQPQSPSGSDLRALMGPALATIAAVRIVLHQYGIRPPANLFDACKFAKNKISVDAKELLQRCVSHIPAREREWSLQELTDQANAYMEMLGGDGLHGRGHDVAPILIKYLNLKGHQAIPEIVEAQLRTSLHVSELKEWPLFSELARRLGKRAAR